MLFIVFDGFKMYTAFQNDSFSYLPGNSLFSYGHVRKRFLVGISTGCCCIYSNGISNNCLWYGCTYHCPSESGQQCEKSFGPSRLSFFSTLQMIYNQYIVQNMLNSTSRKLTSFPSLLHVMCSVAHSILSILGCSFRWGTFLIFSFAISSVRHIVVFLSFNPSSRVDSSWVRSC